MFGSFVWWPRSCECMLQRMELNYITTEVSSCQLMTVTCTVLGKRRNTPIKFLSHGRFGCVVEIHEWPTEICTLTTSAHTSKHY